MTVKSGVTGKTVFALARSRGAEARKALRDARTPEQQLAELDLKPGKASRERRRLLAAQAEAQGVKMPNPNQRRRRAAKRKAGAA